MYLKDLLLRTKVERYIDLKDQFQETGANKEYLKHKQQYYQIEHDSNIKIDCFTCEVGSICKPIVLINLNNKKYSLPCFEQYELIPIEDKKQILEIELKKEYFEFCKIE